MHVCVLSVPGKGDGSSAIWCLGSLGTVLKGSWDLVSRVIIRVTLLITTYNPN